MVVPGSVQVKAQAEAEGLDEIFRAAGFDWRGAGCSMCLGMNPDILEPGRALRLDLEPQLRGPPGPRRPHPPRLAARWPPRPPSRATSSTSATGAGADGAHHTSSTAPSACSTATTSTPTRSSPSSSSSASSAPASASSSSTTGRRSPAGTCRPNPILVDRAATSAAARRASTRPWALEDYGFRAIIAPSFADIFYVELHEDRPAAGRAAAEDECKAIAAAGEGRGRPRRPGGALRRAGGALRDRPRDQAPPAQRPRRHRAHAPAGRRDRRLRARPRALRPGHDGALTAMPTTIVTLPGDGIGPEITAAAIEVLDALRRLRRSRSTSSAARRSTPTASR